jgi:hypothetical protein
VAAALVLLAPFAGRLARSLPACPVRALTGWPCPTCGATRAALALADLDLGAAFVWNPLAAAALLLLVAGGLLAASLAALGRLPAEPKTLPFAARWAVAAALAANWVYLIWAGR